MGKISLTVDNGPHAVVTPEVLQVLADKEVSATFFLIGEHVAEAGRLDSNLFSEDLIEYLCREGYTCALWNVVPRDWENLSGWGNRALDEMVGHQWSVVVVHDVLRGNAEQISAFIDRARDQGHEFVRECAPECLPIVAGRVTQDLASLTGTRSAPKDLE